MIALISALKSSGRFLNMRSAAIIFENSSVLANDQDTQMVQLIESFRDSSLTSDLTVESLADSHDQLNAFWKGIVSHGSIIVRRLDDRGAEAVYLMLFNKNESVGFSDEFFDDLYFLANSLKQLILVNTTKQDFTPFFDHYDDLLEFADDNSSAIAILDEQFRFRFANKKLINNFNLPLDEVMGRHICDLLGERVYCAVKSDLDSTLSGLKTSFRVELQGAFDAEGLVLEAICTPKKNNGRIVGLYLVAQDVTAQRKTLKTLRDLHQITANSTTTLEEKLQSILSVGVSQYNLPLGIISSIKDEAYTVEFCISPNNELSPGMAFNLGHTYCVHTFNNDRPTFFHHTAKSTLKDHPCYQNFGLEAYIGAMIKIDGESWGTLNFSSPNPKVELFSEDDIELMKLLAQWVGNEITQDNALKELKASERQQSLLLNSAHDGFLGVNLEGGIVFANQAASHITGYRLDELLGQHYHDMLHHSHLDGRPYLLEECPFNRTLITGESSQSLAEPLWGKEGVFIGEYNCVAMKDGDNLVQGAVITFQDRTKQFEIEQEVLEQKKLFESLFVDAPSAIALVNNLRKVVMVNPAFCALFGYSAEEVVGQDTAMLYADQGDYARIGAECYAENSTNRQPVNRIAYRDKSGRIFYCETAGSMIKGKDGNVEGYIGHMTDITSRLQGEQEALRANQRFTMASNAAGIGVWEWDLNTYELVWDDWMYRLFGVLKEEVSDPYSVWLQLIHPDDVAMLRDKLEKFIQGVGSYDTEFRIVRLDGQIRHLKAKGILERSLNGLPSRLIGVNLDITAQVETEVVLRKASHEAEMANKAKSNFLATMSHEIRTPLNGVLGMAELLSHSTLTDEQASQLVILQESGESLLELINEILDFSKIEAGQLAIENVDFNLEKTIYDVVRLLIVSAEKKGLDLLVEYTSHTPKRFVGDAFRIKQVLINLVSNAIKFTHQGQVVVSVRSQADLLGSISLSIEVRDSGVGIAACVQDSLFKAFTQQDSSTTRKFGGTGLGLAITKQLVELMGGSVVLQSEEGVGSSFTVSLVLMESYVKESPEKVDLSRWRGAKTLVVDDNAINLMILSNQLLELGIQCDQELDALHAYQSVVNAGHEKKPYDLVILDYQMPELDGLELSRRIREQSLDNYCPAIIIASSSGRLNRSDLQEAGVNVCLTKPVDNHSLSLGLSAALNSQVIGKQISYFEFGERMVQPLEENHQQFSGTVLIVEDMKANIAVARGLIERMGLGIIEAENGEVAVQKWKAYRPDLILMDLHMPVMDGLTAMRAIRSAEKGSTDNKRVPIFALTADALNERLSDVESAGGDGLIAKPFKTQDLVRIFKELFHQKESLVNSDAKSELGNDWQESKETRLDLTVLDELKDVLGDDVSMLFDAFYEDADSIVMILEKENKKKTSQVDLDVVSRAAHSMKSISQNLGGRGLSALSAQLESIARQGKVQGVHSLIILLVKEYMLFSEVLNKER
ncbi:PAS domain S-box protein [Marinomonas sp. TI.3.20]|uniref:PAS domain S-box protein n=1 Tax=Marinomonas sp. TI.3.20 TaxID=3121296 RepID=UPI00311FE3D0